MSDLTPATMSSWTEDDTLCFLADLNARQTTALQQAAETNTKVAEALQNLAKSVESQAKIVESVTGIIKTMHEEQREMQLEQASIQKVQTEMNTRQLQLYDTFTQMWKQVIEMKVSAVPYNIVVMIVGALVFSFIGILAFILNMDLTKYLDAIAHFGG